MSRQGHTDRAGRVNAALVGFIAATDGIGRTNAITNVAWIMAAAGERVLIVDWSTDSTAEHDYLRPFHAGTVNLTDILVDQAELLVTAPEWLTSNAALHRYTVPRDGAADAHVDVLTAGGQDGPGPSTGAGWAARWRGILGQMPYDYVLVDSVTGMSPAGAARDAELLDTAIVCFLPRQRSIESAGRYAADLVNQAVAHIRVIAAPMQFDDRRAVRAKQSRGYIQNTFAPLLTAGAGHELVEIPYHAYDDYDDALAVLLDDPADATSLLSSYVQLATAVMGVPPAAVWPPAVIRERYRRQVGLDSSVPPLRIGISYRSPDRPWADWVRERLERAGADAVLLSGDLDGPGPEVDRMVAVESANIGSIPDIARPDAAPADVRFVVGATAGQDAVVDGPNTIVVGAAATERSVSRQLLTTFELVDRPITGVPSIRYPGGPIRPAHSNLLPRNPAFTGRDEELESLRDEILRPTSAGRWTLVGPPGVGKSEIAREYTHRFGFDYDIIWWVPAHDILAARASLLQLANECGLSESGDAVQELLSRLSANELGRWLLVFDNVDEPEQLGVLQPEPTAGHLLATSRLSDPTATSANIPVASFGTSESSSFLLRNIPGLTKEGAASIAAAVQQLPLGLGMAAAWMREATVEVTALGASVAQAAAWAVQELLGRIDRNGTAPAVDVDVEVPSIVASMVRATLQTLERTPLGLLTIDLARICAHLSPEGVSLQLLQSIGFVRQLHAADQQGILTSDPAEIDAVLWMGDRHGLFDVDWGRPTSLVMHRVVQAMVKGLMTAEERRDCQRRTLDALAEFAPVESERYLADGRVKFAELQRHLFSSGALSDTSHDVRRWLVAHARFVYLEGDPPALQYAARIIAGIGERWREEFGANDELLLRLNGQLANIHRSLGDYAKALELDDAVLIGQRAVLGTSRRQTLITTRGRGADLRGLGRFDDAFSEDYVAWDRFRVILGEDHPDTRRAANNLAVSALLVGDVRMALDLELDNLERHIRLRGDSPSRWFSVARVGVYRRELGEYQAAEKALSTARAQMREIQMPDNHLDVLLINWNLAIAQRRVGSFPAAKDRDMQTVKAYRMLLGENHPYTLGSTLSLAADHHALGGSDVAVELAERCLVAYEARDREHPFTSVCKLNLALYLAAVGRFDDAVSTSGAARNALRDQLSEGHPWSLVASVNHAGLLAGGGELAEALTLAEPTHLACRELLGENHPYTRLSWDNLNRMRLDQSGAGQGSNATWGGLDVDVPQT